MGEIRKRGGRFWIRYYRNGKRYEESAKTDKRGEAIALLRTREGAIAAGAPVTSAMGRLTFDLAVADVVADYKANNKRSLDGVERRIRLHLTPYFGGRRMASIGTAELRAYVTHRQAAVPRSDGPDKPGAANAAINRELAIIRRAFRLAQQSGKLLVRPYVPMLQEAAPRAGFFETDMFETMREHLPAELRGIVTIAFYTGWRIRSEVLPLTWAQIDRRAKVIRLEPGGTKNGRGRTLPYGMMPEIDEAIETQRKEHDRMKDGGRIVPYVFHRDGEPILNFRKSWDKACRATGCPGRVPHDLRRTAVRNLVRAGASEKIAMAITGHLTPSVFRRYDILTEDDLRVALSRLSGTGTKKGQTAESA